MASRTRRAAALIAVAVTLGGIVGVAQAAPPVPTAADRETARGLVEEGKQRRASNDDKGALQSFAAADAIMHVPTTGMLVARTQLALGLIVDARDTALRVVRMPAAPDEPAPFTQARDEAKQLADELAPRIPTLKIVLQGVQLENTSARVTVDDAPVPAAALVAARKTNPGHHVVVAKIGGQERKAEVDLAEKEAKEVTLDLTGLEPAGGEGPEATRSGASGGEPPAERPKQKTSPLVYAGFGVGAAGLIVGTVTGVMTLSKKNTVAQKCSSSKCPPSAYDDLDSANSMATISTIGFVVAGVGAAVGIVGLVVGGGPAAPKAATASSQRPARVSVSPWIGPGSAGVRGVF